MNDLTVKRNLSVKALSLYLHMIEAVDNTWSQIV